MKKDDAQGQNTSHEIRCNMATGFPSILFSDSIKSIANAIRGVKKGKNTEKGKDNTRK